MEGSALRQLAWRQVNDGQEDEGLGVRPPSWIATHGEGHSVVRKVYQIVANLLKTWWPRTELNRRRQPFQSAVNKYFTTT